MSHIEEVLDSLAPAEQNTVTELIRGVPHSGTARSQFNEWCHSQGLVPNDVLQLYRQGRSPTPAPPADA